MERLQRPTLVLSHNKTLAAQLYSEFKAFFPDNAVEYFVSYYDYYQPEAYLPASDPYIEKDLAINDEIEKLRLHTTASLLSGRRDVIVVSSVSCLYGIGNPNDFHQSSIKITVGDIIPQRWLLYKFVDALYTRTERYLEPATFRVKGDTIDVMPAYSESDAYRISMFGDEIEAIYHIDPVTGARKESLGEITIFPANLFVTTKERTEEAIRQIQLDLGKRIEEFEQAGRTVEAQRIKQRVEYDVEMIKELGYCSGIENYSRYMDGRNPGDRPFCLLDYFPDDFLLVVDESHVTIPQVRAMYGGDRARKENLVEYGFRLPAAVDNRPLTFAEFECFGHNVLYCSATPAEYELCKSEGSVVEQLVRPTGLLDPEIEVRPTDNQVDDLLEEIATTTRKGQRVLVTTLTKRMAEELSKYFDRIGIRNRYIHSDVETFDRVQILEDLKAGKIDILIGTHKLVGKQVVWKDLGLLIIDEEQKFGVAVKEKLKALRTNVDVLTLTATPIPRTLQFSLLGARDLSVINTPPPNRYPVQTEMITLDDEDIIKEAIQLEMQRNGQIYVVCNRIEMLPRIESRIHRLCPDARCVIAHGQMPPGDMEEALEAFINYDYDILISTTIIESGVDIANVNTIIIHAAQNYGLSDLHQLRGRVGRSNRKAYCYLVTPDRELLTSDARRRLDALTTFAELGAGFQLAMQDLDIRGAGNMLGSEQSGFIADLGYDTYQRILAEAVEEIREEMLASSPDNSTLFSTTLNNTTLPKYWCNDCQLESDLTLGFPPTYIENIAERISLYRELDSLNDEDALLAYQKRLIDRFGKLPEEAEQLLNVVRLRWLCCKMGIEKVILKQERLSIYFTTKSDKYWQSEMFGKVVEFVLTRPQRCRLVEDKDRQGKPTGKRYATIQQVKTISGALTLLNKIIIGDK